MQCVTLILFLFSTNPVCLKSCSLAEVRSLSSSIETWRVLRWSLRLNAKPKRCAVPTATRYQGKTNDSFDAMAALVKKTDGTHTTPAAVPWSVLPFSAQAAQLDGKARRARTRSGTQRHESGARGGHRNSKGDAGDCRNFFFLKRQHSENHNSL